MPDLSVLIPTFNRPAKLYRQLYYLLRLCRYSKFSSILNKIEFIVCDGSASPPSQALGRLLSDTLDECNLKIGLQYYHFPGTSLYSRIQWMFDHSESKYVMLLGEEDLLIPDYLFEGIEFLDLNPSFSTWSGRLVNVTSYPLINPLKSLSIDERPFAGFDLDQPSVLSRLSVYFALNAVGTNALAYSIQRRSILALYLNTISPVIDSLYYGGMEVIHQVLSLYEGGVSISDRPLIIRDFMYEDYVVEEKREAPDIDLFPYYGEESIKICTTFIGNQPLLGGQNPQHVLISLLRLSNALSPARGKLRRSINCRALSREVIDPQISLNTLIAFKASYLDYFSKFRPIRKKIAFFLKFASAPLKRIIKTFSSIKKGAIQ